MLVAAYHILPDGTSYPDLGGTYFDPRDKRRLAARLVRRLSQLGYAVELPTRCMMVRLVSYRDGLVTRPEKAVVDGACPGPRAAATLRRSIDCT